MESDVHIPKPEAHNESTLYPTRFERCSNSHSLLSLASVALSEAGSSGERPRDIRKRATTCGIRKDEVLGRERRKGGDERGMGVYSVKCQGVPSQRSIKAERVPHAVHLERQIGRSIMITRREVWIGPVERKELRV